MNAHINYLQKRILCQEAEILKRIYGTLSFCKKRVSLVDEARKLPEFSGYLLATETSPWVIDLKFSSEKCSFIIKFPYCFENCDHSLTMTGKVVILMSEISDEPDCKVIVDKFIDILWQAHCNSPDREENTGDIPKEIFCPCGNKIPIKYLQRAAFFRSLKDKGDSISNWLCEERRLINEGFQFV